MKSTTVAGIVLLSATASWAADIKPLDVKLGLWETNATTAIGGMPNMPKMPAAPPTLPEDALAKLPPEQRARMEAMMKSRRSGGPTATSTKVCVTRESLNNGMAFSRADKSCASNIVAATATHQQIHMECNQQGHKVTGDFTVDRVDAEHIKGEMVMKAAGAADGPGPMDVKTSFDTRWISADCGDVKPPAINK